MAIFHENFAEFLQILNQLPEAGTSGIQSVTPTSEAGKKNTVIYLNMIIYSNYLVLTSNCLTIKWS